LCDGSAELILEPTNAEADEHYYDDGVQPIMEQIKSGAYETEKADQHIIEMGDSSNDDSAELIVEQSKLRADDMGEAEQINIETDEFSNKDSAEPIVERPNFETEEPNDDSAQPVVEPTNNETESIEHPEGDFSDSSSEFIESPEPLNGYDQEDSIVEPYERPSGPEPPYIENYDAGYNFSGHYVNVDVEEEEVGTQPGVPLAPCAPTTPATTTTTPSDEAGEETNEPTTAPTANDANDTNHYHHCCYEIPTSPYRHRATPYSWTGLEITPWASESYIDHTNNTLDTYPGRDARTGRLHGLLNRCSWPTHASREEAMTAAAAAGASAPPAVKKEGQPAPAPAQPVEPAGIVVTVTTPEGETRWLGEDPTEYEQGSDVFDFRGCEYGHRCGHEPCTSYFDHFGWFLWPENGIAVTPEAEAEARGVPVEVVVAARAAWAAEVARLAVIAGAAEAAKAAEAARVSKAAADQEVRGMQMRHYMDWQEDLYAGPELETIDEDEELVIEEAAGIEDRVIEDDESDIDINNPLLDRIEAMVYKGAAVFLEIAAEQQRDRAEAQRAAAASAAAKRAEAAAEVGKVSWWDRDPLSTSKLSWADIDELDDEPAPSEGAAAVKTVSRTEGAMVSHANSEGTTEANKVSFWDRDPFYISNTNWADMIEDDDY
jgi:hypothetical protein